jgi:hypothetical protein
MGRTSEIRNLQQVPIIASRALSNVVLSYGELNLDSVLVIGDIYLKLVWI